MISNFTSLLTILIGVLVSNNLYAVLIETAMGHVHENNTVITELINSHVMQRLKKIDQSGPQIYFLKNYPEFSRYDHSLGVYALLKRFRVPMTEQVSGLLHDASHTVFSHVGDILFQAGSQRSESYQDSIHDWYLYSTHADKILATHHLSVKDVSPKNPKFTALEQPYPDMNADRIEYNLHTGIIFKDLTALEVEEILQALHFDNNKWYFTDILLAKKFAKLSTYYTRTLWGSPQNIAIYTVTCALLKHALNQKIITSDEIHFGVDQEIINKLTASNDSTVKILVSILHNINKHYVEKTDSSYDIFQPVKMRGIDPLVLHEGKLIRLSELCIDYSNELNITQQYVTSGIKISFINIEDPRILALLRSANS